MQRNLVEKVFEWDLISSPEVLWPFLSDTPRLNEALNLPPYQTRETFDSENLRRRFGEMVEDGTHIRWEEPPFEWAENGWWSWRRFYDDGPLRETGGTLMLLPSGNGGTHLQYKLEVKPNGKLGKLLIATGHLKSAAKSFKKLTRDIDRFCQKPLGDFYSNFSAASLETGATTLPEAENGTERLLKQFTQWLTVAPDADRIELRSKRLARCLNISRSEALRVCLLAVKAGDINLKYRAVCPVCRGSALEAQTLSDIPALMACRACGAGYSRDLNGSLEVLFSSKEPAYDDPAFCSDGPSLLPHVAVQLNLDEMERREMEYALPAGTYIVRVADGQVSDVFTFDSEGGVAITVAENISVTANANGSVIENYRKISQTVKIERCQWPDDTLSVAEALAEQCFHDLMPGERLADGESAPIDFGVVLAVSDPERPLQNMHDGALLLEADGAYQIIFTSLQNAVDAAVSLMAEHPNARFAMDCGPLTIATFGDKMRYIGTITEKARSLSISGNRGVILTSQRMNEALLKARISLPATALKNI